MGVCTCCISRLSVELLEIWVGELFGSAAQSLRPDGLWPARLLCSWDFSGKNTGVAFHFLLQRIFLTEGSNLCLPHWQADSLPLSHQGSPAWGDLLPKFCHNLLYLGFLKKQTIYSNWLHLLISHLHLSPLCSLVANSTFLLLFTWPSYHQMQLPFLTEIITSPLLWQSWFLLP